MRLRTYLAQERRALIGAGILTLATVALNVAIPFMLRVLIDGFRAGDFPAGRLAWWLVGFLGAALVSGGASYAMRALPLRLGHRLEYRLRRDLFDHLTRLDQAFFRAWSTGDLLSRLSSDLSLVALALSQVL
ncbi:MAG: ABC transporter ATP-binding protein, partial [Candidatus Marinimicrobia bacterium]|nr:ABC transporter ATP-binding protein [Candidatus Neomarinimicrobiota bacterium]